MKHRFSCIRCCFFMLFLIFSLDANADEEGKLVQLKALTMSQETFNIADHKGHLVLVAIWATWCPICLGELPDLNKMYLQYHEAGFDMIALSVDTDREKLEQYVSAKNFSFPIAQRHTSHVSDNLDDLGVTPVFYMVGRDGRVIWRRVGPVTQLFKTKN